MKRVSGALLAAALSLVATSRAWADEAAGAPSPTTRANVRALPEVLELAERNHPTIEMARAKVAQVRAQLDEAHYAPFSQFKMTGGVALAPTVLGNNTFSPNTDVSLTSSLGLAWRAGIDGVVPLWTFGKVTSLWDAAEANVEVNEANLEVTRDAVRMDVRKAYFGLQLARDTAALLDEVDDAVHKGVERLKEHADEEDDTGIDLLELQSYEAELEARKSEIKRFVVVALAGLRFYTGVPDLDIPDLPLAMPRHELGDVTRYLMAAKLYRPEIQMARAGVMARSAQVEMSRAQLFPDIGLGLSAGLSAAPEVADQINPFVSDPGNYFHYGAALVFQWKLDVLPQDARIRYAEAQLEEVRAQLRYALGGVAADVERAHAEAVDWKGRVEAYRDAVKYAKRWLIKVQHGIDVGTVEDKELIRPAKAYATQKYSLLNATMEYDMAIAGLAKATGWDAIAPDGQAPPR